MDSGWGMPYHAPMVDNRKTAAGWAALAVVLAGVFPFASDMLRNFPLFTAEQLAWSLAAVVAGTLGVFAAARLAARGAAALLRRVGRPPGARLANGIQALATAAVFAAFLYDANVTQLRQDYGLPRIAAAAVLLALFILYWAVAFRLGPKGTCTVLAALLAFRAGQTAWTVSKTSVRGDALVGSGEIEVYEGVKLDRKPNIYFFCLESYHGFAALQELYGFENREMRDFLAENGFTVSPEVFANYWYTMSSLQSLFQMGHHYAAGVFGNHDSLYARGFVSGSANYYNPVLNILKRNGYDIAYLLPSDYYYRPGAGLVDFSLLARSWPLAPLKVSLARFIGREPDTYVPDYENEVARTLAAWPGDKPTFFLIKLGAEHSARIYDYRKDRAAFAARYLETLRAANSWIEALCRQIIAKDPDGIIILAGDHGAQSYKMAEWDFSPALRAGQLSTDLLVWDLHEVLLAIRWGGKPVPAAFPYRSLANVMRYVLAQLGGGEALLATAVPDDAFIRERGVLIQTVGAGRPLPEWKPASVPQSR